MALDDEGMRPLRLPDDDDEEGGDALSQFDHEGAGSYPATLSKPPVACYRRYAVWIAGATCLVVLAALLGGGALYLANLPAASADPAVATILISLDGVRPDYLERGVSPNLLGIAQRGVRAASMTSVFPTKTFPNHYSLVTGLHSESHGIVSNVFYDPVLDETFRYTDSAVANQAKWWGGEPLWNTVVKAGLLAACCFWPGSEAPIQGLRPTYYLPYDDDLPNDQRVAQVVQWLSLGPGQRPSFITVYFSTVDSAGHSYGPDSSQVNTALRDVDTVVGYLLGNLTRLGIADLTNVVIVSDHGMTDVDARARAVYLDDYINLDDVEVVEYSPVAAIWPLPGREDYVFTQLQAGAIRNGNFNAFRKSGVEVEQPIASWNYRYNDRIAPVLAVANEGYTLTTRGASPSSLRGNHGFDNSLATMDAIFIAQGPNVTAGGAILTPFPAVDVYNYLAALIGVRPAPTNGTANSTLLREGLRDPGTVALV